MEHPLVSIAEKRRSSYDRRGLKGVPYGTPIGINFYKEKKAAIIEKGYLMGHHYENIKKMLFKDINYQRRELKGYLKGHQLANRTSFETSGLKSNLLLELNVHS